MQCKKCDYTCHEDSFEMTYVDFFEGVLCEGCLEKWHKIRDSFIRALWPT